MRSPSHIPASVTPTRHKSACWRTNVARRVGVRVHSAGQGAFVVPALRPWDGWVHVVTPTLHHVAVYLRECVLLRGKRGECFNSHTWAMALATRSTNTVGSESVRGDESLSLSYRMTLIQQLLNCTYTRNLMHFIKPRISSKAAHLELRLPSLSLFN